LSLAAGSNEFHGSGFDSSVMKPTRGFALNKTFADYNQAAFRSANLGGRAGGFFFHPKQLFWHAELKTTTRMVNSSLAFPASLNYQSIWVPLDERLAGARVDWRITDQLSAFYRFTTTTTLA